MTGCAARKKRRRETTGERPLPSQPAAVPPTTGLPGPVSLETAHCAVSRALDAPKEEGFRETRRVYDVWTQPTVADVYAQLKVAAQMLSRIEDPNLAVVKREMYLLEDMLWQFR